MKLKPFFLIGAASIALAGCAAFPELDGKPVDAVPVSAFQRSESPVWTMNFGNAGLGRMLAEADTAGLDVASARARMLAADMALAQSGRQAGVVPQASFSAQRKSLSVNAGLTFEPDLAGRFDAALRAAKLEHQASGLDLLIARRQMGRAVAEGWVALAEARATAARSDTDIAAEANAIGQLRARVAAGETTGADLAAREQALVSARVTAAEAKGNVALATARLRALGVRTVPRATSLKDARRPAPARQTDLRATSATPAVCAAWLRFRASDAQRAEALAASRPKVVVTSSLAATAATLSGLIAGNAAAVTNSIRLEGDLVDNGASRSRLDQARVGVAQAEIGWLQAASQAEIAALEAVVAQQGAEAGLDAALRGYGVSAAERKRSEARYAAGEADGLERAEAARALASAQRSIDTARASALRAAIAVHATLPPPVAGCGPSKGANS